jgi:hypothetical protein
MEEKLNANSVVIRDFCTGCDFYDPKASCKLGTEVQYRYALRGWCQAGEVEGRSVEITSVISGTLNFFLL